MLYGSMVAGICMNFTRLGNVHALALPLGVHFGITHGVACAIMLPHVMRFNLKRAPPNMRSWRP